MIKNYPQIIYAKELQIIAPLVSFVQETPPASLVPGLVSSILPGWPGILNSYGGVIGVKE